MQGTRLAAVREEQIAETPAPSPAQPRADRAATATIVWAALRALSQRALVALAAVVDLILILTAFALWIMVIANPTQSQLIGVGMYAVFVLTAIGLRGHRAR